jgi:hypothetical protein
MRIECTDSLAERFWSRVDKQSGDGCWLWQGATLKDGYGVFSPRAHTAWKAHRFSWVATYGPIPTGMMVCHKCDVRNCVRPDHLWLGTCQDNLSDMAAKGRSTLGERNVKAKLTEDQVREIRQHYRNGALQVDLARQYGVRQANISDIVRRETWKHVA